MRIDGKKMGGKNMGEREPQSLFKPWSLDFADRARCPIFYVLAENSCRKEWPSPESA